MTEGQRDVAGGLDVATELGVWEASKVHPKGFGMATVLVARCRELVVARIVLRRYQSDRRVGDIESRDSERIDVTIVGGDIPLDHSKGFQGKWTGTGIDMTEVALFDGTNVIVTVEGHGIGTAGVHDDTEGVGIVVWERVLGRSRQQVLDGTELGHVQEAIRVEHSLTNGQLGEVRTD